ncbi:MAG: hypothetical protein AAF484_09490 [Pseudomonadota bacterium]
MDSVRDGQKGRSGGVAGVSGGTFVSKELQKILEPIGWNVFTQVHPLFVVQTVWPLRHENQSLLTQTDTEARQTIDKMSKIMEAVFNLWNDLQELPAPIIDNINRGATPHEEIKEKIRTADNSAFDYCDLTIDMLWRLGAGLEATQAVLNSIAGPKRRGAPRQLYPHIVADAVAKIYVVGSGEMPTTYKDKASGGLGGLYGKTLDGVFDELGIGFDPFGPAECAIQRLNDPASNEFQYLQALHFPETRQFVRFEFRTTLQVNTP